MKSSRKRRNEGFDATGHYRNGMAATRLIASLTGRAADRFAITVIGDEPEHAYNRIQLSPVLGGEKRRRASVFR
jgi:NAD(P)H-nitrite reductase large subunit